MSDQQQQQATSPIDALNFLDGILGQVAGSRKDHGAIQGAIGIIGAALTPADEPVGDLEALASAQSPVV